MRKGTREEKCPFCGKTALHLNHQKIPVCRDHKTEELNLKCACGEPLTVLHGKYGPFLNCISCGNMTLRKALGINFIN